MSNTSMQSVAGTAAMTQEPVTTTVMYAVTGDPEVDLMAGMLAVFKQGDWDTNISGPFSAFSRYERYLTMFRVCRHLMERFAENAKEARKRADAEAKQAEELHKQQQAQAQKLGTLTAPAPPSHYYTTSGTLIPEGTPLKPQNPYGGIDQPMVIDWENPFTKQGGSGLLG